MKAAFLNRHIKEEIYMEQPEGSISDRDEQLVCKLQRCLYGLKQAARTWNLKENSIRVKESYSRSKVGSSLYFRNMGDSCLYILLYVGDMLICHEDDTVIAQAWRDK